MTETILYVEDDANDQFLIQRVLKKLAVPVEIRIVNDGDEALAYLEGAGKYSDRQHSPLPTVIFLDIKLPKRSGLEVLEWIKNQDPLKTLPVIMVTGSALQPDIDRAYELGASAYLVKPVELETLQKLFKLTGALSLEDLERPSFKTLSG